MMVGSSRKPLEKILAGNIQQPGVSSASLKSGKNFVETIAWLLLICPGASCCKY